MKYDPFNIEGLKLSAEQLRAITPKKIRKRRERFAMVPLMWLERLGRAKRAKTSLLAIHLCYLHWENKGEPFKLNNGMLRVCGIERRAKWHSLEELERLGLVTVERHRKRAPLIKINCVTF